MNDMNNNERGRITGMPGTETTVTLYPQRLTARMRNSIIRMIEARAITGGWSSQARRLAENIAEKFNIQCSVTNSYRGLRVVGVTESAAPLVSEVVHADWVAWLLDNPEYRTGYYRSQYEQTMRSLENLDQNFYCNLQCKDSGSKVIAILAEHTTQEMKDKSKAVADLLRGTEPINIVTF
jgi:hypothetical protein